MSNRGYPPRSLPPTAISARAYGSTPKQGKKKRKRNKNVRALARAGKLVDQYATGGVVTRLVSEVGRLIPRDVKRAAAEYLFLTRSKEPPYVPFTQCKNDALATRPTRLTGDATYSAGSQLFRPSVITSSIYDAPTLSSGTVVSAIGTPKDSSLLSVTDTTNFMFISQGLLEITPCQDFDRTATEIYLWIQHDAVPATSNWPAADNPAFYKMWETLENKKMYVPLQTCDLANPQLIGDANTAVVDVGEIAVLWARNAAANIPVANVIMYQNRCGQAAAAASTNGVTAFALQEESDGNFFMELIPAVRHCLANVRRNGGVIAASTPEEAVFECLRGWR